MFLALDLSDTTFAGVGAFVLAVSGLLTSIVAMRKARQEGDEHCHQQLKEIRADAEKYAQELYKIRLEHPELMPRQDEGRSTTWLIVSVILFILATILAARIFTPPVKVIHDITSTTTTTITVVPGTGTNTVN